MRNIIVTAASGQDRYTNSQKASYIAHSAIVHYPAIYVRYITDQQNQLVEHLRRFIKGALVQSIELLQTKYDLSRIKLTERQHRLQKEAKNTRLQSGGVLTIAEGRNIIQQWDDNEFQRAYRLV